MTRSRTASIWGLLPIRSPSGRSIAGIIQRARRRCSEHCSGLDHPPVDHPSVPPNPLIRCCFALVSALRCLALRHWHEGHAVAVASRRWEGLVEAGDLYRRIGARGGFHVAAVARARECYLTALLRARGERSLDGVLRATEAFVDLGDEAVVERGLDIARQVAAHDADPRGRERVELLAARWAARTGRAGAPSPAGGLR